MIFKSFIDRVGKQFTILGERDTGFTRLTVLDETSCRVDLNRKQCFEAALALVQSTGADLDDDKEDSPAAFWLERAVEAETAKEQKAEYDEKIKEFLKDVLGLGENVQVTEEDQEVYRRALKWRENSDSDILTYENAEYADKSVVYQCAGGNTHNNTMFRFKGGHWAWVNDNFPDWQDYPGKHLGYLSVDYFPMKKV